MYYSTSIQSGVNTHSKKDWYTYLSEFADADAANYLQVLGYSAVSTSRYWATLQYHILISDSR